MVQGRVQSCAFELAVLDVRGSLTAGLSLENYAIDPFIQMIFSTSIKRNSINVWQFPI
jgi:hypothetical protein